MKKTELNRKLQEYREYKQRCMIEDRAPKYVRNPKRPVIEAESRFSTRQPRTRTHVVKN